MTYKFGDPLPDVIVDGKYARAFRLDTVTMAREHPDEAHRADATIDAWWVEATPEKRFHWCIKAWGVSVIHLRSLEGQPPAFLRHPEAQYELIILARDPNVAEPLTPTTTVGRYLTPPNVMKQFDFGSAGDQAQRDRWARQMCEGIIATIVYLGATPENDSGLATGQGIKLVVDVGVRQWWEDLVDQTVEHILTGGHHHGPHS